ncbi:hypothetical protein BH24ACT15_BH24ACT15_00580 [soil metagenome]
MSRRLRRASACLTVVIFSACSTPTFTTEVVMSEFAYEPVTIALSANEPGYVLTLTNDGSTPHDFNFDGLPEDVQVHLAVLPGGEAPYPLPGLPAGEYPFYCAIEGHREAGMEGVLEVS